MIEGQYIVVSREGEAFAGEGIRRKVEDQLDLFEDNGIHFTLDTVIRPSGRRLSKIAERLLPWGKDLTSWDPLLVRPSTQVLYVRRPGYFSARFVGFLRDVKAANPQLRIYLEIPTYPYEKEFRLREAPLIRKDRRYRATLSPYVDYIVDLFGNDELFGIPTVSAINGTTVTADKKRRPSGNLDRINMVCAANYAPWHGIDRLIAGMADYYEGNGKRELFLTLVGGGPEFDNYKKLTQKRGLVGRVCFLDEMSREKLFETYSGFNLGVESLARHRTGTLTANSSLKSRDYLVAGLPFFGEGEVDVLKDLDYPYYMKVPDGERPIDCRKIIAFFDSVYGSKSEQEIIDEMHEFALRTVDMKVAFGKIVESIKEECGSSGDFTGECAQLNE